MSRRTHRVVRDARRVARTGGNLAHLAADAGEATLAAMDVLAHRGDLLAAAAGAPHRADHSEMARMASEKVEAAGLAGLALLESSAKTQQALWRYWQNEARQGAQLMLKLGRCTTPAGALQVQAEATAAALKRWASLWARLGELAAASGAAAFLPYHRSVTQNARRLARRAAL